MKNLLAAAALLLGCTASTFAQTDRGTITGAVSDATNAVLPGVSIAATNTATGTPYETVSTETGNYTLTLLPAGVYDLSAELPGFKKYVRQGITVLVAQTLRIDVRLEVGATTEQVTVTADAPLLRTEGGDVSHNITTGRLNELPILGIGQAGAGSLGIRNPLAAMQLIPGTLYSGNNTVRVNGLPNNTESIRIEGQDASNGFGAFAHQLVQPSVDAVQEVSIQTSNYAAEYGQAGGGVFNYTMRSGANEFHGSVYDNIVHDRLNAGVPFTSTGGANRRERARRHDYGFNVGGPISFGKLYNAARNKTFFFANFEEFRETILFSSIPQTVPTLSMRNGDFRQILTGRQLGTDPLGRPIMEGTIYDPATTRLAPNGQVIRDPFPNNTILRDRFDPVALKIQALVPEPTNSGLVNNIFPSFPSTRITTIPGFKIDHNLTSRSKLSFYFNGTNTDSQFIPTTGQADGLPAPITTARGSFTYSHVERLNYDQTLSPTLLLHIGAGYQHEDFKDNAPTLNFDPERELGLKGATLKRNFPTFNGLLATRGGLKNLGPGAGQVRTLMIKPSANASLTWIKGNHTYKWGSEFRIEGYPSASFTGAAGIFTFSGAQTGLPFVQSTTLAGGDIGFPYASFLLGLVDNGNISSVSNSRFGKTQLGFFIQDTWKVTRAFTLDYGLRYDYSTYFKEQYGRAPNFAPSVANPNAGGALGASIFEGNSPERCKCEFSDNYPWAFGPRLGAAWQFIPRTVLRLGWGISYDGTPNIRGGVASNNPFTAPSFGEPAARLKDGIPLTGDQVRWPKIDPGLFPVVPGLIANGPTAFDRGAGRPPRIMQWSVGLQREITPNLVVEAAYVGNRSVWWQANSLVDINALTPERIASFGLDLNNTADRQLLRSPLNSSLAAQRGFNKTPYPGFPLGQTVAQSLRPFPQFLTINASGAPQGNTWYDSLQVKVTKRVSRGLDFNAAYTWQKELQLGTEAGVVNDVFNRDQNKYISGLSRPQTFVIAANYRLPRLETNEAVSWALRDWTLGAVLRYASGLPIRVPTSQNRLNTLLFRNTTAVRVPGEPLFLKDLNCGCIDPKKDFVLNPNAWTDPPDGQFGNSPAYYGDYRFQRRPQESMSLGRIFRMDKMREGASLEVRVQFDNIFNRPVLNDPDLANANSKAPQIKDSGGNVVSGFGRISTGTGLSGPGFTGRPREGLIIARVRF